MKKNKRNYYLFPGIAVVAFMLTGCIQADFHTTVNKDGSADLDYKIGLDQTALALMMSQDNQRNPIDELKQQEDKNGFTTTNYTDGSYVGVEAKKHVANLSEVNSGFLGNNSSADNGANVKMTDDKHFFYDVNNLKANFGMTNFMNSTSGDGNQFTAAMTSAFMSKMDMKFELTLPVKADQNNASKVTDGTNSIETYQWTFLPGQNNQINLQAKVLNVGHIVLVVGIAIVLLIVLAVLLLRKKKSAQPVIAS